MPVVPMTPGPIRVRGFGPGEPFLPNPSYSGAYVSVPTAKLEFAPTSGANVINPTWVDITPRLISASTKRGRQYQLNQMQAGTMTLVLDNTDRAFDPTYAVGPYFNNLLPMRRFRLSVLFGYGQYFLFTGYAQQFPIDWEGIDYSETTITCTDGFRVLQGNFIVSTAASVTTGFPTQANSNLTFTALTPGSTQNDNISVRFIANLTAGQIGPAISVAPVPATATTSANSQITIAAYTNGTQTVGGVTYYPLFCDSAFTIPLTAQMVVNAFLNSADATTIASCTLAANDGVSAGVSTGTGQLLSPVQLTSTVSAVWYLGDGYAGSAGGFAPSAWVVGANALSRLPSGGQINQVLDAAGWPSSARAIDAGQTVCEASAFSASDNQTALGRAQQCESTEFGVFFMAGNGNATFHDRLRRQAMKTSLATFGDIENPVVGAWPFGAPLLDTFQRANGTITGSHGYSNFFPGLSSQSPIIINGICTYTGLPGTDAGAQWVSLMGPSFVIFCKVVTIGGGVKLSATQSEVHADNSGYLMEISGTTMSIKRVDAGITTGTLVSGTGAGPWYGLLVQNGILYGFTSVDNVTWTLVCSIPDATYALTQISPSFTLHDPGVGNPATSIAAWGAGNAPTTLELEYLALTPDLDDQYIVNDVHVTPFDGAPDVVVDDAQSQLDFTELSTQLSPLIDSTGSATSRTDTPLTVARAQELIYQGQYAMQVFKRPGFRFSDMTVQPVSNNDLWTQALQREISDRLTIRRRPKNVNNGTNDLLQFDEFIESVAWTITNGPYQDWNVKWELSPAYGIGDVGQMTVNPPSQQWLILDDPLYGLLDWGNIVAY